MYFSGILFIFISIICANNGARILGIFHVPAHSHQQLGNRLLYELAAKGHEVTIISPNVPKKPIQNVKIIQVATPMDNMNKSDMFINKQMSIFTKQLVMDAIGQGFTEFALNSKGVQDLLKSNQQFDVVIMEEFLNEAFRGFCYHFKAPCIVLSTIGAGRWSNRQMGNPENPSYVPDIFLTYSNRMSFFQRFYNTLVNSGATIYHYCHTLRKQNELLQKHFPGSPHIYDLYYNTSLMLVNSHVSTNAPVPLVPNMIPIGGYHIQPPKPLPKDIQDYLDGASDGAVYFSMGSNLRSADMGKEKIDAILKVFGKLKQKVLWKWENNELPGQPANVKLGTWLPQQDILAHPNIKLFITHGGLLSTIEALYHGVPVVGIPIFGDQEMNMAGAVNGGYAVEVLYEQLNADILGQAVDKVLNDPRYRENAQRRSKIMRDEPMKPLDRAVFWVEYVIRHQGAPHLRTAALNLEWYQYLLLDVVLFIITVILVLLYVIRKIVMMLFRKKNVQKVKKDKKLE